MLFVVQVATNDKVWKRWFDTDQPEIEEMPDGYNQSLDTFRKLLMIRAWCPDRIIPQARIYIANSLGNPLLALFQPASSHLKLDQSVDEVGSIQRL